ncbi:hypothetical protein ACOJBM_42325 [Rhizobium beringeri]
MIPEPDEGYLREGNVAVAQFEIEGAADDTEIREARILRQRAVNDVMLEFFKRAWYCVQVMLGARDLVT